MSGGFELCMGILLGFWLSWGFKLCSGSLCGSLGFGVIWLVWACTPPPYFLNFDPNLNLATLPKSLRPDGSVPDAAAEAEVGPVDAVGLVVRLSFAHGSHGPAALAPPPFPPQPLLCS